MPEERLVAILEFRAEGHTLKECGQHFGVTREAIRQAVKKSGIPVCRKCKKPGEMVEGRRLCAFCLRIAMNNRPSKRKKRSGYRKDPRAHKRAHAVRLANLGFTLHEIAERIGYTYQAVSKYFAKLRREGREFPIGRDPYFDRGKKK